MKEAIMIVLASLILASAVNSPRVCATSSQELESIPALPPDVSREPILGSAADDFSNTTDVYADGNPWDEVDEVEGIIPFYVVVAVDDEEIYALRAMPDNSFEDYYDYAIWQIERGDESLVENFGIDIRILGFWGWDSDDSKTRMSDLWYELESETHGYLREWFDGEWWSGYCDAIIGITAQPTPNDDVAGRASSLVSLGEGKILTILKWQAYWADDNLVAHEISHLFYAIDHDDPCCRMADHKHFQGIIWEDAYWLVDMEVYCAYTCNYWCMDPNYNCYYVLLANCGRYPIRVLEVRPCSGGTTIPAKGNYSCTYRTSATVSAVPDPGYILGYWYIDGYRVPGWPNPITITMDSDHTVYCSFTTGNSGCPYVSTWNGTCYTLDNNLIPAAEYSNGTDVTDYYMLQQPLTRCDRKYALLIWDLDKHSFLDQVRLLAVDHGYNVNVGISPSGQVLTYKNPTSPTTAYCKNGTSTIDLLSAQDGNAYQGYRGDYIELDFGANIQNEAKLVITSDFCTNPPCAIMKSPVYVQTVNSTGTWQTIATIYPRVYWSTDIIDLGGYLPDASGELKIRLVFTSEDKIDYVGLDTSEQREFELHYGNLVTANHSKLGDVKDQFMYSDNLFVEIMPGEQVALQFTMPQNVKEKRDYVIIVEGHYFFID